MLVHNLLEQLAWWNGVSRPPPALCIRLGKRVPGQLRTAFGCGERVAAGVRDLPIGSVEAERAAQLGEMGLVTGDTADRFILATALVQECPVLTLDQHMLSWEGPVNCIDASR